MTNPYTPGDHITHLDEYTHTNDNLPSAPGWLEALGLDVWVGRWKSTPRVDECGRPTGEFDIRERTGMEFFTRDNRA